MWVWQGQDGRVRGIVSLGCTETEFSAAFRRWPTTLRSIAASDLKAEIMAAIHPGMIFIGPVTGRYQRLKLFVWPRKPMRRVLAPVVPEEHWIEPMPVLV